MAEDRVLAAPTTADLRWWWVQGVAEGVSKESAEGQFDRWFTEERSKAWERGRDDERAAELAKTFPVDPYRAAATDKEPL